MDTANENDMGMDGHEDGNSDPQHDLINAGQPWIAEAIAQQEEHLRRIQPCIGGRYPNASSMDQHSWDTFSPRPGTTIQQCWRCGVTKTDEDYQRKLAAQTEKPQ